jgi:hypothetical protein
MSTFGDNIKMSANDDIFQTRSLTNDSHARLPLHKAAYKRRKKTQHEKFVEPARESGADESEDSFVAKIKAISSTDKAKAVVKPRKKK